PRKALVAERYSAHQAAHLRGPIALIYFKRIVTPPTAADTSAPTLGPLSCRITPLAFCNCTPPAPAAMAPPAPIALYVPSIEAGPLKLRARPTNLLVEAPIVKPTLMPDTVNG